MPSRASSVPLPPQEFIDAVGGGDFRAIGLHVYELVRDRCGVQPDHRMLDIGSGCGRVAVHFMDYLSEAGRYEGFDIVEPMVAWCNAHISSVCPNFRFQHAALTNTLYSKTGGDPSTYRFPYDDDSFDVLFATSVFTHLVPRSAEHYASEVARVLKPGGKGLLTFYVINDEFRRQRAEGADIMAFGFPHDDYSLMDDANPEAVIAYEDYRARDILTAAGLTIADMSYGFWRKPGGWTYQDAFLVTK